MENQLYVSDSSLNNMIRARQFEREAEQLGTNPTLWLGYNALNELLHGKMQKSFEKQKSLDAVLFDAVSELI
jgi:hypothetical protein